jgi:hypothetical protein
LEERIDLKSAFQLYIKEKRILENKAPRTIESYEIAFRRYQTLLGELSEGMPTEATLKAFVVSLRESGLSVALQLIVVERHFE